MEIKNHQRFSELEFCLKQYFSRHFAPIMSSVESELQDKKLKETENYRRSTAGILTELGDASHMMPGLDTSSTQLKAVGKWNSKTTEDYLNMVRKQIAGNKDIQKDIAVLASQWRKAVIDEVGRKAYDNASKQIGTDLANAYVAYRFEEQMLGKMVSDRMPKSSVEYVLRKASERSILGLDSLLTDSAVDREINERMEAKYKPTNIEKGAAKGTAFVMDVITMGGVGSWSSLAKMAGTEAVFSGLEAYTTGKKGNVKTQTVEECISQGVFQSRANVFTAFRKDSNIIETWDHPRLIAINKQLSKKIGVLDTKPMYADNKLSFIPNPIGGNSPLKFSTSSEKPANREGIPMIIAPGKEDEYREFQKKNAQQTSAKPKTDKVEEKKSEPVQEQDRSVLEEEPVIDSPKQTKNEEVAEESLSGWDGLLKTFGLNGLSATGHNLGYVIAMLPDVLFGALTGRSKNLGLEDNLIPIASVIAGMFIRNPLLKMTLIGLGGANLLNKAGKDALGSQVQEVQSASEPRFKQYADEPLNDRITGVSIQSGALICNIDKVPCTISLPPATVAAYEAGALPLNTLANAVLSRHDAMQNELALNYQQQYEHMRQQNQSTGIK